MYIIYHIIIALAIMFGVMISFEASSVIAAACATSIYFFRELVQYFILKKTHEGDYDHGGWFPVLVITFAVAILIY